jgi:hypothetical protein
MDTETSEVPPILKAAWTRVAQLDVIASKRSKEHLSMRRWIAVLGVLTTLYAILIQQLNPEMVKQNYLLLSLLAQVLFIATPFLASTLFAFTSRKYSNDDWLIARAGAEEIKKEIYLYRTVHKNNPGRYKILSKKLREIQRLISINFKGEFSFLEYEGASPNSYVSGNTDRDSGFNDLSGEEYLKYRLEYQLNWHNRKISQYKAERDRLNVVILTVGTLGSIIAALGAFAGGNLSIWVALIASITAALIGWQELRNIDLIIPRYSNIVSNLTLLRDYWQTLELEERTQIEFFKMVIQCEKVLSTGGLDYTRLLQEIVTDINIEDEMRQLGEAINSDDNIAN